MVLQRTEIGSAFGLPWICLRPLPLFCLLDWKLSGGLDACLRGDFTHWPCGFCIGFVGPITILARGCQTVGSIWWNCGIGPIASLADSNGAHLMSSALHKADNVPPAFPFRLPHWQRHGYFVLAATWLLEFSANNCQELGVPRVMC